MAHRLTKEQLDEQFELFLKESVSDDSVDFGTLNKQTAVKSSKKSIQKPTVSWWPDDDDPSDGGAGRETTKNRFLKAKKSQPVNDDVVAAEPVLKPVPKPRSKAPDTTPKETVYRTPSEDSDSLSAPAQENLQRESGEWRPDETPAASREGEDGMQGSGKSFRKSQRRSQSIQEEEEDVGEEREGAASVRDHTETHDSVLAAAANTNILGLDTLEEEEEKARFFSQLEAGASSSIDYSKLNKDLDSTSSADLRRAEDEEGQSEDDQRKARVTETIRESPPGSPHYSEDFEEEDDVKEKQQEKKVSPILAKVSLYDSLEDTGGDDRTKNTAGSLDRGQAYVQSGASEMEALHEAYRQIHVVQDSDDHHSDHEGKARNSRPASPPSPPRHAGQSLQPASTAESELPTAEELMRPIRPETDQIRGFSLQPVSTAELNKQKTPVLLEETFPDMTSPEFHVKHPAKTNWPSGSPDSPDFNLTWSIRQEVERLMKDQNKHDSPSSSQAAKSKKQQVSLGSTFSRTSPSPVRKPLTAPVRGRRVEGRTAVTSRSSGTSRAAAAGSKTQPAVSRPLQHPQRKTRVTKSQEEESCADPNLRVSSELVSSVQSLVSVLKQQMDSSRHTEGAETLGDTFLQDARSSRHLQNNKREEEEEERPLLEELRVQLARRERELQAMKAEVEEVTALRQQNFLLQSKLRSAEEVSQKKRSAEVADSAAEERQIEKEIKEQETLIKGYQQENEKLYLQMKAQQAKSKANEEAMFNENQTLLNQLAFTRDQVNKNSRPVGNVCVMDHTRRIADLLAQIDSFQRTEVKLCDHVHTLQQEKQALEVDLQLMKTERDRARTQAVSPSGDKTLELRVLEEKHREEVLALKRKLQWFAENQELLDRDAGRLKAATVEIHQLQEQVEKLKSDVSRRSGEQQRKSREKTAETKRMQDLERQVKELEQILRRRNPNSLPALIYAAATAGGPEDANTSPPSRINALLERRIQRLEAELEGHDEEAKRSLRAMEQQFQRIKLRYEQQISDLEQQLEQKHQLEAADLKAEAKPSMSQVQTLEEELQRAKETHQEKEKSLQDQIESLQQQLKQKAQQSPGRHQRQAEAAFGVRIDRLNQELAAKTRTIQELSHTVERLQKERRGILSVRKPRSQPRPAETKKQAGPAETVGSAPAGEETFPTAQYEKTYQPTIFTGSHISEVLQENEDLKRDLELLQLQSEREKEAMIADAAQAREELCRLQGTSAEQLTSLKAEHLRVLDRLRASHALEHAASKVAELTNKLHAQEMTVKHLQDQLRELHGAKDALVISRTREDALQKQLTRLLQELKDAKEAQSPEVKLMCSLEKKIFNMELRHQHREKELQQVISSSWQTLDSDQLSEVERWKRLAQDKSREVEAFRLELDSILDILRHLQRQGVVLTPISTVTAPSSTQRR